MKLSTTALWVSMLRIMLAPVVLIYLTQYPYKVEVVLAIVVIAAISDFLDGYIARAQNLVSKFGAILDYTADKVFVLSTLMILSIAKVLPFWITIIILYREIIIMGLRMFATHKKMEIPANHLGKLKTAVLFVAIIALLLKFEINYYLFVIGVFLTVLSFLVYVKNFFSALPEDA